VIAVCLALTAPALGQPGPTYRGQFVNHIVEVTWSGWCNDPVSGYVSNSYAQASLSIPLSRQGATWSSSCSNYSGGGTFSLDFPAVTPDGTINEYGTLRFTSPMQRSAAFNGQWQLGDASTNTWARDTWELNSQLGLDAPAYCPDASQTYGPGLLGSSYPITLTRQCSRDFLSLPLRQGTELVYEIASSFDTYIYAPSNPPCCRVIFGLGIQVKTFYRVNTAAGIELEPATLEFQVGETNPAPQLIALRNSGTSNLTFAVATSLSGGGDWLAVSPAAGTLAAGDTTNLNVTVTAAALPPDLTNTATLSVSGNAANSPQQVRVEVVQTPVRLIGLEVVQVVQDWRNSVPLIAGKETTVRAHLQSLRSQPIRVKGKLRLLGYPEELVPLEPANPGGFVMAQTNALNLRHQQASSLTFWLPGFLAHGAVTLRLEADGVACREAAGTPNDCAVTVSFQPATAATFKFVGIHWVDAHGVTNFTDWATLSDLPKRIGSCFPLGSVVKSVFLRFLWEDAVPPRLELVNERLNWMSFLDTLLSPHASSFLYFGAVAAATNESEGLAFLPGDVCSGYVPPGEFVEGRHTVSHELAHCLGQHHAPYCGAVAGPAAPVFPYVASFSGRARPTLGPMFNGPDELIFGYDHAANQIVSPYEYFELMGYCSKAPLDLWPSKFTYEGLISSLSNRFAATPPVGSGGTHRLVRGRIDLATDAVTLPPMVTLTGNRAPTSPPAGAYTARLRNGAGQVIQDISFAPSQSEPRGNTPVTIASFIVPVPEDPAIRQVEILHHGEVRGLRTASANPPTVHLDFPNGGETLVADPITVTWTASDPDGDPLTYVLQYSTDAGVTWDTLAVDLRQTAHTMPRAMLARTTTGRLRVIASDGFHTAMDMSDASLTAANNPPTIQIKSPVENALLLGNQSLALAAFAYDAEDGTLDGTNVVWNSDRDGVLGYGAALFTNALALSEGPHLITADARDSFNETGTAQVHIMVRHAAPASIADLAIAQTSDVTEDGLVLTLTAENLGPSAATGLKLTDEIPTGTSVLSATPTLGAVTITNGLLTCVIPELAVGQSAVVTLRLAVPSAGSVTNITDVKGLELDPVAANSFRQAIIAYQPAPPQLRIELSGNAVVISWPASTAAGFVLQSSLNLLPGSWSDVPDVPAQVNGRLQVIQSLMNTRCFYRLLHLR
jgi:uncharacterized repeat protein (TIGR01451 family)